MAYRGRFAPSPTGLLHAGSLVAALASWLDARAHGGAWLVRIEDIDTPRCAAGAGQAILGQLAACGLRPDEPPWWQSTRGAAYAAALRQLRAAGQAYDCGCTRKDIELYWLARGVPHEPEAERVYPGTCRPRPAADPSIRPRPAADPSIRPRPPADPATRHGPGGGLHGRPSRAVRFRAAGVVHWHDRRLGAMQQDVAASVGDFVLHRADGLWAYQLAVVVDDAAQGITDVVRGEDLADNTARQILLQRALGLPTPRYLHTPLVLAADGRKLSKQNGATPLDLADGAAVRRALQAAGGALGLPLLPAHTPAEWLAQAVPAWAGIIAGFPSSTDPS